MKLLSVYYTHKPGGFCRRLYRFLGAAQENGHQVHYFSLDPPPQSFPPEVEHHSIPFPFRQRSGLLFWALFTLWCPIFLAWKSASLKPDLYCVFGSYYSSMLVFARAFHKRPLALFLRSLVFRIDAMTGKAPWLRFVAGFVERLGLQLATRVVFMTQRMKEDTECYFGQPIKNSSILPNDLPPKPQNIPQRSSLSELHPELSSILRENTFLVLSSGVLDERKNISFLLKTFQTLKEKYSPQELLLLVAGDGPLLRQHQEELRLKDMQNVLFLGWKENLFEYTGLFDLVLHPSLHEGMPNSALEALSLGVPVLCSDIPEHREMLDSDELLFSLKEHEALASRLSTLIDDPLAYESLKKASKNAAQKYDFNWEKEALALLLGL